MKRLIIILLFISLNSFGADEQNGDASISLLTEADVMCATNNTVVANQNLSEQVSLFFSSVFDTQLWPARWQCGVWSPFHGWLYILSDLSIALSYFLIPLILLYFIYKQKQQRTFRFVVLLFTAFILACGLTHLIDASIFWWPAYRLSALIRFATASVSLATVFALVKVTPQLLQLRGPKELEQIVKEQTEELRKNTLLISAYQYALNESSIVAITDQYGKILHVNENFCKISKYSKDELIGEDHRIINSGYHSKTFIGELWKTITAGKIWKGELKNKAKDGTIYWVDTTIVPFLNEEGKPYQYVAIRSDITARKNAEDEQALLASIVNSSVDAIIGKNMDSIITSWNKGSVYIFGYTAQEAIGKPMSLLIPTSRMNEEIEIIKEIKEGNHISHFETERMRKDGNLVPVSITISPIKDVHGNIIGASTIARDISDRKNAEEEIVKNEKRFRGLVENNNDIIRLSDRDFKPLYRSPNLERITGWKNEDIEEEGDFMLVHPDDRGKMVSLLNEIKSNPEKIIPFTYRLKHKAGHFIWVEGTGINMLHDESIKGIITNFRDVTERKNSEEKLASNEKRFRALIENSYDVISLLDESFKVTYRSPSAIRVLGWTNEELETQPTTPNVHPDDLEYLRGIMELVRNNPGKSIQVLFRNKHKNGHYLWLEGSVVNWLQEESLNAIVFNFRDVTERKKLEELLLKANTLARIGSWEVDLQHETVYWSDITREIHETEMDYLPDLASGINFYKEGSGRDLITQKVMNALELGKPWDIELQIVTAKNNERWVRSIGEPEFVNGKCIRIYGSFQDIDKRKRAEEKLIESEKLYRSIYENTGEAILLTIPNGTIISANTIACQIFDRTEEEICGLGRSGLVNTRDPHVSLGLEKRKKTGLLRDEWTFIKRDGTIFPGEVTSTVFKNSEGEERSITIIRDITERKKSEDKIKNLNSELEAKVIKRTEQLELANKELESFSYSVSHDLRAPLRAVNGYAKMLQEDYQAVLDQNANRLLGIVRENAKQMGQLIDDLLAFSKLGRKEIQKEDINMTSLAASAAEEVKVLYPRSEIKINPLHSIRGDNTLLKQVLLNYISNGAKYSSKKEHSFVEIKSIENDQEIIFSVRDNGAGFNMNYAHKLFNVFQRLHKQEEFEGTGVGIAIVSRIIGKHGGRVWAEGETGKGATFYFSLPKTINLNN